MRPLFLSVGLLFFLEIAHGQELAAFRGKPTIKPDVFGKWQRVASPAISNSGDFVLYFIRNKPIGRSTMVIRSIGGDWKIEIPATSRALFTKDSHQVVFLNDGDSLGILHLDNKTIHYIANATSFQLVESMNEIFVIYRERISKLEVAIMNLSKGVVRYFDGVKGYFSYNDALVMQVADTARDSDREEVQWFDLSDFNVRTIFSGPHADNFIFDKSSKCFCFLASDSIWCYKFGDFGAKVLADSHSLGVKRGFIIDQLVRFSKDGNMVFFSQKKKIDTTCTANSDFGRVDVWSYSDIKLQSQQISELNSNDKRDYIAVIHISNRSVVQLEYENDMILWAAVPNNFVDTYMIVLHREGEEDEWNWNKYSRVSAFLVSTLDGTRKQINVNNPNGDSFYYHFSPDGRYVIYYDADNGQYISYSVLFDRYKDITKGIKAKWTERNDFPNSYMHPIGIAGFVRDNTSVILYERDDIYQVDLNGDYMPINLTRGAGNSQNIVFRFAFDYNQSSINVSGPLLLNAFNRTNKDNGFYYLTLGRNRALVRLTMQPYMFEGTEESRVFFEEMPIKAKDSDIYLVRRMSSSESPNYFMTRDFRSFSDVTNTYPEKDFNWLTTELITWKTFDGSLLQGVLFKPENFDPGKRYPIIFYYYERLSEGLYGFTYPDWSEGPLNIPYYVSNGYLVFEPDIFYRMGYPGGSAYNSVVSAAYYFRKKPWIDSKRMGLQGHSFGGYETDYIIAHSDLFAAACSASGWADFIRAYGEVRADGTSRQGYYELRRERMGTSLWGRPDLYIANSPIFMTDKIVTPLLMMNNKRDDQVSFSEGVEFFTALRRLDKRVWMLQYHEGDHIVLDKDRMDFTIRMQQFFDYYLKDAPPPKWMVEGLPAAQEGCDDALELEPAGTVLKAGLVAPARQRGFGISTRKDTSKSRSN